MIDNLISSDFTVLAREHCRVPPIEAMLPREREKAVRRPWKLYRWIVPAIACGFTVVTVRSQWFERRPLSAPLIALAIASLLGLLRSRVRESFTRQLGAIFAAIAVLGVAVAQFGSEWLTFSRLVIDRGGCVARFGPIDETSPLHVVAFSTLAIAFGYVAARVVAIWLAPRRLQPWSSLAKISIATTVITWVGVTFEFVRYGRWLMPFRLRHEFYSIPARVDRVLDNVWPADQYEGAHLSQIQFQLVVVAVGIAGLIASIGLAYRSRSKLGATWLAIVEHVVVAPVGVAFGMANLAYGIWAQEAHGPNDASLSNALAMAGVLVAFTSMMLRRLRAVEAGNATAAPRV